MTVDVNSLLQTAIPAATQIVNDFAGSNAMPPQPPVVVPMGAPVYPTAQAAMAAVPVMSPPVTIIARVKAWPMPTKLIAGAVLGFAAYHVLHGKR